MKFFITMIAITSMIISCSDNDDREDTIIKTPKINGTWKPVRYEFKGKTYPVTQCEAKGQILINDNLSGVYEKYTSVTSGNCNMSDSFSGNWTFDAISKALTLTYTENGLMKTLTKDLEDFSDTELKIGDSSKDLDNTPGNDEAILVFTRQ
jgi:hypothetical protein